MAGLQISLSDAEMSPCSVVMTHQVKNLLGHLLNLGLDQRWNTEATMKQIHDLEPWPAGAAISNRLSSQAGSKSAKLQSTCRPITVIIKIGSKPVSLRAVCYVVWCPPRNTCGSKVSYHLQLMPEETTVQTSSH